MTETPRSEAELLAPLLNSRPLSLVRAHVAAFGAGLTFAFIVGRLLAMANFDTNVALAIAGYVDPPKALLGMVVDLSPIIVVSIAMFLASWAVLAWRRERRGASIPIGVTALAVSVVLFTSSLFFVVGLALYLVILLLSHGREATPGRTSGLLFVAIAAIAIGIALSPFPWLSPERVQTTTGAETVGYVLGFSGEWVAVLEETQRTVVMIRQDDVVARIPCVIPPKVGSPRVLRQTLPSILTGRQPVLPPCF